MKTSHRICLALYALSGVALLYGCLNGGVTFGHGLGDVFDLLLHVVVFLLVGGFAWWTRRASSTGYALVVLVMLCHVGLLGLQLTVFRGVEYRWNHRLFYP